jgi:quercetin dioxygenase-like cupin family protein
MKATSLAATFGIAIFATTAFATFASAGECPADQVMAGAVTSGATAPKGVEDTVISSIDLTPKGGGFENQTMRMRRLVIQPGGIVPWHDHAVRPANIFVVSGEVIEHRSTCKVPIVHRAGDVTAEFGADLAHWWQNKSKKVAVLISADIVMADKKDDASM